MEKEGIKMETHQNWIKASKKTQNGANQIWTEQGGGLRWWQWIGGGGVLWRMMMFSFFASLFKLWRLKEEEEDEIQR